MKGYIYLIRNKDLYKIGITKDINKRMKVLKPDEIIKVFKTRRYKELEKELHKRYQTLRIPQTEYFRLSKSMAKVCKNELNNYSYRRSKSNPWLVAIMTIILPSELCIIWGIRHKSWNLALVPIAKVFSETLIYAVFESNEQAALLSKLIAGTITFTIIKRNKFKELNKKDFKIL